MERDMRQMSEDADQAFRGFFDVHLGGAGRFWQPAIDIHETQTHLLVKMELAGARAEELNVSLSPDDRVLTVSGVRSEGQSDRDKRMRCHQLEIYFGPFERAIGLPGIPVNREEIKASYRDGFLLVSLPKRQGADKPQKRTIPIDNEPVEKADMHEHESEDK
jgi:HSP20 family protein